MFDKLFHHSEKHKMLKYFCKQRGCSFEQDAEIPPPIDCPVCNNPAHFEVEVEVEEIVSDVDADNKNPNTNNNDNDNKNSDEKVKNESEENI